MSERSIYYRSCPHYAPVHEQPNCPQLCQGQGALTPIKQTGLHGSNMHRHGTHGSISSEQSEEVFPWDHCAVLADNSAAYFVVLEQRGCSAWQWAHPQLASVALV